MRIFKKLSRLAGQVLKPIYRPLARAWHASGALYCPVCEGKIRRFLPHGDPPRPNARCPICGSLERHRLDWVFFRKKTDLFDGRRKRMLHIAPEEFLIARFGRIPNLDYLSADLNRRAMVKMDITDIRYADDSFDIIYCSHVLEHIENDRKALSELHRVLSRGGWAALQVPILGEKTFEDPAITSPEDRHRHFGQWDHVRCCGPDYVERMRSAGFTAEVVGADDVVSESDRDKMGILPNGLIFLCRKPSSDHSLA
jgi:hypothetical protein